MRVLDCDPTTLALRLPPCAHALTGATLTGPGGQLPLTITSEAPDDSGATLVTLGGIPATAPKGVYTLNIASDCGCWYTDVYLNLCPAPALASTHYPTAGTEPSTECCLLEPTPTWADGPPYVVHVTWDGTAATLLQPAPTGLLVAYAAEAFTVTGVPGGISHLELLDANGILLATSTNGTLPYPSASLHCTTYALRINAPVPMPT